MLLPVAPPSVQTKTTFWAVQTTLSSGMTSSGVPGDAVPVVEDEVLIRELLEGGNEQAFRTLYRRHTPRLFQMVLRTLGCTEDAEDVVQETWIRAVESVAAFRGESRFYTWLAAIAINRVGDRLRRNKRWVFDNIALESLEHVGPAEGGGEIDMERAIAHLPAGCRTVLVLHDVEGFTHEEIAAQLGVTTGTSKSQLFRARRALRRMFEHMEEKTDATA